MGNGRELFRGGEGRGRGYGLRGGGWLGVGEGMVSVVVREMEEEVI